MKSLAQSHPANVSLAPQPHSIGPWPGGWRGTVERHQVAGPGWGREPTETISFLEILENKGTCTHVFGSQGLSDICVDFLYVGLQ